MTADPIPPSPLPDYLLPLLTSIARDRFQLTNFQFRPEPACADGAGLQGTLLRVHIDSTDSTAAPPSPQSVICKLTPASRARRVQFNLCATFRKEHRLLADILPALHQFQLRRGVRGPPLLHYPQLYGAHSDPTDPEHGHCALVMEDLSDQQGARMLAQGERMGFKHVRLVVREIGRLHGFSMAVRHCEPQLWRQLRQLRPERFDANMPPEVGDQFWVHHFRQAEQAVAAATTGAEDCVQLRQHLQHMQQHFRQILRECETADVAKPFAVLNHGDMWANNVMFAPWRKQPYREERVYLVDWQQAQFGSPALDLAHFLYIAVDQAMRTEQFENLLRVYLKSVRKTCKMLGAPDAERMLSPEDLGRQMQRFARWSLLMVPMMVQLTIAAEVPDMDRYAEEEEERMRMRRMAKEEEVVQVKVPTFGGADNPVYAERVIAVLRDFRDRNYDW